jgi:hypothetical protein
VAIAAVALLWVFARVDEIEPPRIPLDFAAALLPELPPAAVATAPSVKDEPGPPRRLRGPRRAMVHLSSIAPPAFAPDVVAALAAPVLAPESTTRASQPLRTSGLQGESARAPRIADLPVRLPPRVGEKHCLSCPLPQLGPQHAVLALGQEMMVKTCVSARGEVTSVDVLRGFDAVVDARVTETIRGWRLSPYSLEGHPVPFCYATRFVFATH